jgi:hypothetical protein
MMVPMTPTEEQIISFQALYKNELGIDITPEKAVKEINSLVFFVQLCMVPTRKGEVRK